MKRIRLYFHRLGLKRKIRKIEKALGLTFNEMQRRALMIDREPTQLFLWNRQTGKTLTACLWVLLHVKGPIKTRTELDTIRTYFSPYPCRRKFVIPDPDVALNLQAANHTIDMLVELERICRAKGIRVCRVIDNRPNRRGWQDGGRRKGGEERGRILPRVRKAAEMDRNERRKENAL